MAVSTDDSEEEDEQQDYNLAGKKSGIINSVGKIDIYPACLTIKCSRKKLDKDNKCPSCNIRVAPACAARGIRAIIGVAQDGTQHTLTVFNQQAEQLYQICTGSTDLPSSAIDFEDNLFESLPKEFIFTNNLTNIITFVSKC